MNNLPPPKFRDITHHTDKTKPRVVAEQKDSFAQHVAPFVSNCTERLSEPPAMCGLVYCRATRHGLHQRNSCPVAKGSVCHLHLRQAQVPSLQGLLFRCQCDLGGPHLIICCNMPLKLVTFLLVPLPKWQSRTHKLPFVAFCQHLLAPFVNTVCGNDFGK